LYRVVRTRISRLDGLATGEALILAMPEADTLFSKTPAKIDLFIIDHGGEIQEPGIEVLNHASG
jgi:hypothetical protein